MYQYSISILLFTCSAVCSLQADISAFKAASQL
jgi:hypothetical protein